MLKNYELSDLELHLLFEQMIHPEVYPFVRLKADTIEQFRFIIKQALEAELRGEIISRVIFNASNKPIGAIHLFDIHNQAGFLGTWIGKDYHGKGYNQLAKEQFLYELFYEKGISNVFMRIRHENIRSKRATEKLPYTEKANHTQRDLFKQINKNEYIYDLYEVKRDTFIEYYLNESVITHDDVIAP